MQRTIGCLAVAILLAACQREVALEKNQCNADSAKQLLIQNLEKNVQQQSVLYLQELTKNADLHIDLAQLRQQLSRWQFNVTDVRTDQADDKTTKLRCITTLVAKLPPDMLVDANTTRAIREQPTVAQQALLANLELNHVQALVQLHYVVQPTDDGSKLYVTLDNPEPLASFIRDVSLDALLRIPLQDAIAEQQQQEQQYIEQQQQTQAAYRNVLAEEARNRRDMANQQINLVWNATTPQIRKYLLPEQRLWLKKRKLECELESQDAEQADAAYFDCEAKMTRARTQLLNSKIQQLEQQVAQSAEARAAAVQVRAEQQQRAAQAIERQQQADQLARERQEQATAQAEARAYEAARLEAERIRIERAVQEAQGAAEKQE